MAEESQKGLDLGQYGTVLQNFLALREVTSTFYLKFHPLPQ